MIATWQNSNKFKKYEYTFNGLFVLQQNMIY